MSRMVSFIVLVAIVLVIGFLALMVLSTFLLPLFLAALLVVLFRPLHLVMLERCKGRRRSAAGLTTGTILLIVLLPMSIIFVRAGLEAVSLVGDFSPEAVDLKIAKLRERLGLVLIPGDSLDDRREVEHQLAVLQDVARSGLGRLSADRFDEGVDSLQALVERIDKSLRAAGPVAPAVSTSLDQFAASVAVLDDYRWRPPADGAENDNVAEEAPTDEENAEGVPDDRADLRQAVSDVSTAYQQYRRDVSGGRIYAPLKELAHPSRETLRDLVERIGPSVGTVALRAPQFVGGFVGKLVIGLGVMIVSLYYFLADGPSMINAFMRLSPLEDRYEQQLLEEFANVSRAVVMATLLSAVVQGLLAGVGYFLAGFDSVFFLVVLTMFLALIPFVGAAAVWVPCSLWLLFYEERTLAAALLALFGVLVVSMADNIIKPYVLHGQSNLHPLMGLLSVLGGVSVLGPIGILVGPMAMAFLQAVLNILQSELTAMDKATGMITSE